MSALLSWLLYVDVEGARSDRGSVRCFAYTDAQSFPTQPKFAVAQESAAANAGRVTTALGLPRDGRFAVACFHDEDDDGSLRLNLLGIPTEGTGASRGAHGHFGPPTFDDASFDFVVSGQHTAVTVTY